MRTETAGGILGRIVRDRAAWRGKLGREKLILASLVVPALVVVVALQLYPLGLSAFMSVQDWHLVEAATPQGFVGLRNYREVVSDTGFTDAVANSAFITGSAVVVELIAGTVLAYLTVGANRLNRSVRTILILPMVIAPVATGTIWRMLFNSRTGPINFLVGQMGLGQPDWLSSPWPARVALVIVDVWQWTPFVMVVIAAGFSAISGDLLEAAEVDGASKWKVFRYVEFPLLAPLFALVVMFRVLESLLSLDTVYTLTFGGPGSSTYTLTFYIYVLGLRSFALGQAAAASWMFMAFAAITIAATYYVYRRTSLIR
jgi:multiple sugar transport system permease protein